MEFLLLHPLELLPLFVSSLESLLDLKGDCNEQVQVLQWDCRSSAGDCTGTTMFLHI